MTLTRMLLSFHFAGNVGGYSTTREFAFPAPLLFIGYDPFSDHNGDLVNPIDDRGDDWLYSELFPIKFAMYQTPGPTTFVTLFGGADEVRSLEGQRKFGSNVAPFMGMRWTHAPAGAEEWVVHPQVYLRALVEDHGL